MRAKQAELTELQTRFEQAESTDEAPHEQMLAAETRITRLQAAREADQATLHARSVAVPDEHLHERAKATDEDAQIWVLGRIRRWAIATVVAAGDCRSRSCASCFCVLRPSSFALAE